MTDMFSAMIDGCFRTFGQDATYQPVGGGTLAVRVILGQAAEVSGLFDAGIVAPAHVADARVLDIAAPLAGDQLVVDGTTYIVRQTHQDAERLVWRLDLDKQ
jgi:hypothetical protein